jgi:elongation factor P hydroxylase
MSETKQPMFKILLETLKGQSEFDRAMFLADTEENLLRAYQEGVEARKKRVSQSKNPYPAPKEYDMDLKYTTFICWNEGYADVFFSEDNKIFGRF